MTNPDLGAQFTISVKRLSVDCPIMISQAQAC